MAKKSKRDDAAGTGSEAGNESSANNPELARPWTDEEMAAAKPLPLPTVDTVAKVRTPGVPYAGKGETKPAGRPEDEDEAAAG
jgi:hypothetical protein